MPHVNDSPQMHISCYVVIPHPSQSTSFSIRSSYEPCLLDQPVVPPHKDISQVIREMDESISVVFSVHFSCSRVFCSKSVSRHNLPIAAGQSLISFRGHVGQSLD